MKKLVILLAVLTITGMLASCTETAKPSNTTVSETASKPVETAVTGGNALTEPIDIENVTLSYAPEGWSIQIDRDLDSEGNKRSSEVFVRMDNSKTRHYIAVGKFKEWEPNALDKFNKNEEYCKLLPDYTSHNGRYTWRMAYKADITNASFERRHATYMFLCDELEIFVEIETKGFYYEEGMNVIERPITPDSPEVVAVINSIEPKG